MKRRSNSHQLRLITEISVTPLLDLALILLLVFMVAAPLMKNESSLLLPASSSSAKDVPPEDVITLGVDEAGAMRLGDEEVAREGLVGALGKLREKRPEVAVLVEMHHALPVQRLVEIMDGLTAAGVTKTSIVAKGVAPPR